MLLDKSYSEQSKYFSNQRKKLTQQYSPTHTQIKRYKQQLHQSPLQTHILLLRHLREQKESYTIALQQLSTIIPQYSDTKPDQAPKGTMKNLTDLYKIIDEQKITHQKQTKKNQHHIDQHCQILEDDTIKNNPTLTTLIQTRTHNLHIEDNHLHITIELLTIQQQQIQQTIQTRIARAKVLKASLSITCALGANFLLPGSGLLYALGTAGGTALISTTGQKLVENDFHLKATFQESTTQIRTERSKLLSQGITLTAQHIIPNGGILRDMGTTAVTTLGTIGGEQYILNNGNLKATLAGIRNRDTCKRILTSTLNTGISQGLKEFAPQIPYVEKITQLQKSDNLLKRTTANLVKNTAYQTQSTLTNLVVGNLVDKTIDKSIQLGRKIKGLPPKEKKENNTPPITQNPQHPAYVQTQKGTSFLQQCQQALPDTLVNILASTAANEIGHQYKQSNKTTQNYLLHKTAHFALGGTMGAYLKYLQNKQTHTQLKKQLATGQITQKQYEKQQKQRQQEQQNNLYDSFITGGTSATIAEVISENNYRRSSQKSNQKRKEAQDKLLQQQQDNKITPEQYQQQKLVDKQNLAHQKNLKKSAYLGKMSGLLTAYQLGDTELGSRTATNAINNNFLITTQGEIYYIADLSDEITEAYKEGFKKGGEEGGKEAIIQLLIKKKFIKETTYSNDKKIYTSENLTFFDRYDKCLIYYSTPEKLLQALCKQDNQLNLLINKIIPYKIHPSTKQQKEQQRKEITQELQQLNQEFPQKIDQKNPYFFGCIDDPITKEEIDQKSFTEKYLPTQHSTNQPQSPLQKSKEITTQILQSNHQYKGTVIDGNYTFEGLEGAIQYMQKEAHVALSRGDKATAQQIKNQLKIVEQYALKSNGEYSRTQYQQTLQRANQCLNNLTHSPEREQALWDEARSLCEIRDIQDGINYQAKAKRTQAIDQRLEAIRTELNQNYDKKIPDIPSLVSWSTAEGVGLGLLKGVTSIVTEPVHTLYNLVKNDPEKEKSLAILCKIQNELQQEQKQNNKRYSEREYNEAFLQKTIQTIQKSQDPTINHHLISYLNGQLQFNSAGRDCPWAYYIGPDEYEVDQLNQKAHYCKGGIYYQIDPEKADQCRGDLFLYRLQQQAQQKKVNSHLRFKAPQKHYQNQCENVGWWVGRIGVEVLLWAPAFTEFLETPSAAQKLIKAGATVTEVNEIAKIAEITCEVERIKAFTQLLEEYPHLGKVLEGAGFVEKATEVTNLSNIFVEHRLNHIFKSGTVKFADTLENRNLIKAILREPKNYVGTSPKGIKWYQLIREDGKQIYIYIQKGVVKGAGINKTPRDLVKMKNLIR